MRTYVGSLLPVFPRRAFLACSLSYTAAAGIPRATQVDYTHHPLALAADLMRRQAEPATNDIRAAAANCLVPGGGDRCRG